ncbi:MAG: hypothetical protein KKA32_09975 [Actinobacteria bacterium]|nr:hypothetical protein [Actinomycetota bacterium]
MRRDQLEHAIRAACDVSGDTELLIFGSQAILGSYPNAPVSLRASIEVDIQAKNLPESTDLIDGTLGELSRFHTTHGFYVHGVSIEAATLPRDWDLRTVAVSNRGTRGNTGYCLEAHDLAASKLVAGREKDRIFAATLLMEKLVDSETLLKRSAALPVEEERRESISRWIRATVEDIA